VAFDALYSAHRQTLHACLLGRTGEPELALDLLQEVFIRAWRNMAMLEGLPPERQRAWLLSVARNLVVDNARAAATRQKTTRNVEREAALGRADEPSADVEALQRERLQQLDAAIRGLPEDLRTVLVLQVVDGRNSTEIGELLDRPPGTVRYQLAQARRILARELAE
jgi:RNA polymerase sigma-70 factor (ECF subfamily)